MSDGADQSPMPAPGGMVTVPAPAGAGPQPITVAPAAGPPVEVGGAPLQIVPLRALPLVAAVLVALVVVIVGNWMWGLDFFHVVGGALWTGIDLFLGLVLGPILGKLPIPARVEFSKRFMPKMIVIMPTLVVCTMAAGWQLARLEGNLAANSVNHPWLIASYCVVAVMAVVALAVLEPANLAVLFELRKPEPNGLLVARLMRRFIYSAGVTGLMQIATLVIMTRLATS